MTIDSRIELHPPLSPYTRFASFWRHGDRLFNVVMTLAASAVIALVVAIGYELWRNSALSREAFGWAFLYTAD